LIALKRAWQNKIGLVLLIGRTQTRKDMTLPDGSRRAYLSGFYETAVEFKGIFLFFYS